MVILGFIFCHLSFGILKGYCTAFNRETQRFTKFNRKDARFYARIAKNVELKYCYGQASNV